MPSNSSSVMVPQYNTLITGNSAYYRRSYENILNALRNDLPTLAWIINNEPETNRFYHQFPLEIATATLKILTEHINYEHYVTKNIANTLTGLDQSRLAQLNQRIKSPESLARKINLLWDYELNSPRKNITDVVRYTIISSTEKTIKNTVETIGNQLYTDFFVAEFEHSYNTPGYKDIKMLLKQSRESSTYAEIQFHTEYTLHLKNISHSLYEKMRDPTLPKEILDKYFQESEEIWKRIPLIHGLSTTTIQGISIREKKPK